MSRLITLGIETSCDETALAIIETSGRDIRVLASLVHSQAKLHSAYGGVYPTLAKREHGKNLVPLLHKLLTEAKEAGLEFGLDIGSQEWSGAVEKFKEEVAPQNPELYESFSSADFLKKIPRIDRVAVTEGPGLEPALWVGITFAQMLSNIWKKPLVAVDHMEGHIVGSLIPSDAPGRGSEKLFEAPVPAVAFLISGGHTQLVKVESFGSYKILGETVDDAVGEAFDKAARLLGLPYPGGPHLSIMASKAREQKIESTVKLPRPMIKSGDLNFSFSGLKTAVLYAVRNAPKDLTGNTSDEWKMGLAREFEDAVVETLAKKLRAAIEQTGARSIIVGGGVAANHSIRESFKKLADEYGIPIFLPSGYISGDNALMIAVAGSMKSAPTKAGALSANGTKRLSE